MWLLLLNVGCISQVQIQSEAETIVDFEVHHNILIIDGFINNKWGKFIIDTGASVSLLDVNQANKYKFDYFIDTDSRIQGFGGNSRLMRTSSVHFGLQRHLQPSQMSFRASDLSNLNQVLSHSNQRIVGILGTDFLEMHGAVIDYPKRKLVFGRIEPIGHYFGDGRD